jgi:hypothetical protein
MLRREVRTATFWRKSEKKAHTEGSGVRKLCVSIKKTRRNFERRRNVLPHRGFLAEAVAYKIRVRPSQRI